MHQRAPQKHLSLGMFPGIGYPATFGSLFEYTGVPNGMPAGASTTAAAAAPPAPSSPFSLDGFGLHDASSAAEPSAAESPYVSPLLSPYNTSAPPVDDGSNAAMNMRTISPLFTCQCSQPHLGGIGTTFPEPFPFGSMPQHFSFDFSQFGTDHTSSPSSSAANVNSYRNSLSQLQQQQIQQQQKQQQKQRAEFQHRRVRYSDFAGQLAQPLCVSSRPSVRKVAPRITVDEEFFLPKNKIKEKEEEIHSMILTLNRHFGISD